mgnify:CR=1 FL=1
MEVVKTRSQKKAASAACSQSDYALVSAIRAKEKRSTMQSDVIIAIAISLGLVSTTCAPIPCLAELKSQLKNTTPIPVMMYVANLTLPGSENFLAKVQNFQKAQIPMITSIS